MKHPTYLKIGARVKWRLRNGATATGRVDGNDVRTNGVWTAVNTAPKGSNRILKHLRPSQLSPA